jgi:DNA-binding NarL/FixJ family response regulator
MDEQTKPLPPESEPVTQEAVEQKALEVRPPRRHTPTALPPSANKRKVGKGQRPPHRGAKTPKNSYTSPRAIVSARKRNEAVALREQGYSLAPIAKHLKVSEATIHGWIVEALRSIPMESAQEVLRMELRRLDCLLSAFIGNGIEGDLPAACIALGRWVHRGFAAP